MPTAGPALNPDAIRAFIELNGYSLAELGRATGMSSSQLSNLIAGRRGISHANAARLARALRVPPAAIAAVVADCAQCRPRKSNGKTAHAKAVTR